AIGICASSWRPLRRLLRSSRPRTNRRRAMISCGPRSTARSRSSAKLFAMLRLAPHRPLPRGGTGRGHASRFVRNTPSPPPLPPPPPQAGEGADRARRSPHLTTGEMENPDLQGFSHPFLPPATLVTVPFQNNSGFNNGPFGRTQNVLNIEPVVPMSLNAQWNVISRTIVPVITQPNPLIDSITNGVGDISESLFFSPVNSGIKDFTWGFGPIVTAPSASDPILGTGKTLLGPTLVLVATPGHWVMGVLVNNQWSVSGALGRPSVNFLTTQYFINYN